MQYEPHKTDILAGVARVLFEDVLPRTTDKALRFRVRIAAHLLGVVAREVAFEGQLEQSQNARMAHLLDTDANDHEALIGQLMQRIGDPKTDASGLDSARRVLMDMLSEDLAILNPRFDTSLDIDTHA